MRKYHRQNESNVLREEVAREYWAKDEAKKENELIELEKIAEWLKQGRPDVLEQYEHNRSQVETKDIQEYNELYHQMRFGDLYLLWRDQEIPMSATGEISTDTDAEPNSVMTFWHTQPILDTGSFGYMAVAILDTDKLSENFEVQEGKMRYGIHDTFDEVNYSGELPEVYVKEKIDADLVSLYINEDVHDWLSFLIPSLESAIAEEDEASINWTFLTDYIKAIKQAEQGVEVEEVSEEDVREYGPQIIECLKWLQELPKIEDLPEKFKNYQAVARAEES